MSVEEDTELRDLISQTLEANGCFAKLRAQLRASIYLALDEDDMFQKKEFLPNKKLNTMLETVEGKLMFCIVREFLEYFDLDFTISVFEPETYMGSNYQYMGRYKLLEDLKLANLEQESRDPVLLQLINICKLRDIVISENSHSSINSRNEYQNVDDESNSTQSSINDSEVINRSLPRILKNNLNETFNVKRDDSPSITENESFNNNEILNEEIVQGSKNSLDEPFREKPLIDFDKSVKVDFTNSKSDSSKSKSLIDQTIVDMDFSQPIVKDKHSKDTSFEKLKLASPKSDKIKVKNNLSSLSDLPPLPISKSRSNDMLLPSLYTKDFKDNKIKEIEKLFELEPLDNYEEDFISESEIDLTGSKQEEMRNNSVEEIQGKNIKKLDNVSNSNNNSKDVHNEEVNKKSYLDNSASSSVTSEDFELNSNIDDILNSC